MDTEKKQYAETKERFKCDLSHYFYVGIVKCILGLLLLSLISSVQALKSPDEYGYNQCELIAKDYRDFYGGDLILIQPLKDNGAYELGDYAGHMLNKAWNYDMGVYYIDYQSETLFKNTDQIKSWYRMMTDKESEVFNVNQGGVPFAIYWHY